MHILCYSLLPVTYNYSLEKVHSSQHGLEGFILVTSGLSSLISLLQFHSSLCFSKISLSFQPHRLAVIFPSLVLAFSSFTSLGVSKISNLHVCIIHLLPNPDKQGLYLDYSSYQWWSQILFLLFAKYLSWPIKPRPTRKRAVSSVHWILTSWHMSDAQQVTSEWMDTWKRPCWPFLDWFQLCVISW